MPATIQRLTRRTSGSRKPTADGGKMRGTVDNDEIYLYFQQFLSQQLAEIHAACRHVDESSLVDFYLAEWARYYKLSVFVSAAFAYINRHWVARYVANADSGIYKFEDASLLLWRENIIEPEPRVSLKVLEFIRRHREYQLSRAPANS